MNRVWGKMCGNTISIYSKLEKALAVPKSGFLHTYAHAFNF